MKTDANHNIDEKIADDLADKIRELVNQTLNQPDPPLPSALMAQLLALMSTIGLMRKVLKEGVANNDIKEIPAWPFSLTVLEMAVKDLLTMGAFEMQKGQQQQQGKQRQGKQQT